jgi:hypothetical protein
MVIIHKTATEHYYAGTRPHGYRTQPHAYRPTAAGKASAIPTEN